MGQSSIIFSLLDVSGGNDLRQQHGMSESAMQFRYGLNTPTSESRDTLFFLNAV